MINILFVFQNDKISAMFIKLSKTKTGNSGRFIDFLLF